MSKTFGTVLGGGAEQVAQQQAAMLAAQQQNRATADHALKRLDNLYELTGEQMTSASKWLLATLVAINGGGDLATINLLPRLANPVWPAGFFTAGLLLTVLSGAAIQHIAEASFGAMEPMSAFWRLVAQTGAVDEEAFTASRRPYNRLHRIGLIAPALGWIAGLCFFAGLISLAHQASVGDPDNNQRCLALQRDMLSAVPQRKDGATLFQAFGCHPQGGGSVMVPARPLPQTGKRSGHA